MDLRAPVFWPRMLSFWVVSSLLFAMLSCRSSQQANLAQSLPSENASNSPSSDRSYPGKSYPESSSGQTVSDQLTEQELIDHAIKLDCTSPTHSRKNRGFTLLLKHYEGRIRAIIKKYWREATDTDLDDAVQQVLLKAFSKMHQYRGDGPFNAWVFAIAKNHAIDQVRKLQKVDRALSLNEKVQDGEGNTNEYLNMMTYQNLPTSQKVDGEEDRENAIPKDPERLIRAHLEAHFAISETNRQAFYLYEYKEKPYKEIAKELNTEVGTVKSRIKRARIQYNAKLKELLPDETTGWAKVSQFPVGIQREAIHGLPEAYRKVMRLKHIENIDDLDELARQLGLSKEATQSLLVTAEKIILTPDDLKAKIAMIKTLENTLQRDALMMWEVEYAAIGDIRAKLGHANETIYRAIKQGMKKVSIRCFRTLEKKDNRLNRFFDAPPVGFLPESDVVTDTGAGAMQYNAE